MKLIFKTLFLFIVSLGVAVPRAHARPGNDCGEPSRAASPASSAVSIDSDGNIWLSGFGRNRVVGQDVRTKTPEPLDREYIPASDILINREQFTCVLKGWRIVVFATVHPTLRNATASVENRLVVAIFRGSTHRLVLEKTYPGIIKLALADINGDGSPELAVQWTDGALISPATWLDIWRIETDGTVVPVDLKAVKNGMNLSLASHADRVELGNYATGDFSVYSEQRLVKENGIVDRVRKQYVWNDDKAAYVFKSELTIQEKVLTSQ